jgi:hypothetical protein
MWDVFVSHVEEDSADALAIADALEAAGFSTWCYERDSIPGPSYLLQTGDAVEESRALVVLISRHSLGSRQVTVEIVRGHETAKPFLPVLVDLSHVEFTERQPEWREAMGAATSIMVPREGVAPIVPRIVQGLKALGVEPSGATPEHRTPLTSTLRRRGPAAQFALLPSWQRIGLVLAAVLLLSAGGWAVVVALSGDDRAASPGESGDETSNVLRTDVGKAEVTNARLEAEYCPPSGRQEDCTRSSDGTFVIVTLAGTGGDTLTIGLTMESNRSFLTHGDGRYDPAGMADESQGIVRLVYTGAPESLAGEEVTLVWPDGQRVKFRVEE